MTDRPRTGVLLVQLGTPDAPTPPAVRRYLAEFLGDRRVVDLHPLLWRPILHGVVLRTRPKRSAALYRRIWTPEGSPLLVHSRAQEDALASRLGPGMRVELGMRYGIPRLRDALDRLVDAGCQAILVLPLFPQYGRATTASVLDVVSAWARGRQDLPRLVLVRSFADDDGWAEAVAATVRETGVLPAADAPLVFSFHGIPQRYADAGDPYPHECEQTALAVARRLGLDEDAWGLAYQSRFGRAAWLRPYLDDTLRDLAASGVRRVAVATPSFVADCLETIDEVGRESRRVFLEAGGEDFVRVPCPNARPEMIDALERIVRDRFRDRLRDRSGPDGGASLSTTSPG